MGYDLYVGWVAAVEGTPWPGGRHITSVYKRITFDSTQMHNLFRSGNLRKIYPQ